MTAAPSDFSAIDYQFMESALRIGARGLGQVWPNPSVGCVIVSKSGVVLGRGVTQPGGRPHGETESLKQAGQAAKGATAYVTLEPCAHHGKTPPCAEALIKAGVARVVAAITDPDPRTAGQGLARLRDAGIAVETGLLADKARELTQGFLTRVEHGRPMVTLKLATSLDGKIAAAGGASRWITGEEARASAHLLRASHDAILVGSGTALADDPALTCRLPGMDNRSPVRIVADSRLRLPLTAQLVTTARQVPTWILMGDGIPEESQKPYIEAGVTLVPVPLTASGRIDPAAAMKALGGKGLTRVLVEGGGQIAAAMVEAGLADQMVWYRAPMVLGGSGVPGIAGLDLFDPSQAPRWQLRERRVLGRDVMERYSAGD